MTTQTFSPVFTTAWELHTKAFSVIPSGGGVSGKAPIVDWAEYQKRLPTTEELLDWEKSLHPRLWGIVTGLVNHIVVIDVDTQEAMKVMEELKPHVRTPRGGAHYYFTHPGTFVQTKAGVLPKIDIRGDGGFVNAVGEKYRIEIFPTVDTVYPWDRLPTPLKDALNGNHQDNKASPHGEENWVTELMQGVPEGQRDATCTRLAGYYLSKMPPDIVKTVLYPFADKCIPPLPHTEVDKCVNSIVTKEHTKGNDTLYGVYNNPIINTVPFAENSLKNSQNRDRNISNSFQIEDTKERINYTASFDQVLKDAGRMSRRDIALSIGLQHTSDTFRQIVSRRLNAKSPQVRNYRGSSETLEWVNRDYKVLSLADYRSKAHLSINLPLNLNKYVHVPAGSVVGVAGYTSAWKTSLLLEICELNVAQDMPVYYWFNEMSEDRMLERLEDYPQLVDGMGKKFQAVKQTDFEFYDVIDPDGINVIDYLDMDGEGDQAVYMIGGVIKKLQQRLEKGIVIFALQKPKEKDLGYGGVFSAKLSNLYLSLNPIRQAEKSLEGRCKIVKSKDWSEINPVGLYCNYYTGGKHGKIISDNRWIRE